jgi:hypothetical protein
LSVHVGEDCVTKPTIISDNDGQLEVEGESDAERAERKKFSARCGHVKRRVLRNERLTGPLLEFALDIVPDEFGRKLKAGEALSDYE